MNSDIRLWSATMASAAIGAGTATAVLVSPGPRTGLFCICIAALLLLCIIQAGLGVKSYVTIQVPVRALWFFAIGFALLGASQLYSKWLGTSLEVALAVAGVLAFACATVIGIRRKRVLPTSTWQAPRQ